MLIMLTVVPVLDRFFFQMNSVSFQANRKNRKKKQRKKKINKNKTQRRRVIEWIRHDIWKYH